MGEQFGNDFITISDEEGREYTLEHIATTDVDEQLYMAFLPADMDEDEDDFGVVILKVIDKDSELMLEAIADEEELKRIHAVFVEMLSDEND